MSYAWKDHKANFLRNVAVFGMFLLLNGYRREAFANLVIYLAEESIVTVGKRFTRYLLIFFS